MNESGHLDPMGNSLRFMILDFLIILAISFSSRIISSLCLDCLINDFYWKDKSFSSHLLGLLFLNSGTYDWFRGFYLQFLRLSLLNTSTFDGFRAGYKSSSETWGRISYPNCTCSSSSSSTSYLIEFMGRKLLILIGRSLINVEGVRR